MSCRATVPLQPRESAEFRAFYALWHATRELVWVDAITGYARPGWSLLVAETATTMTAILERRGDEPGIWINPP